MSVINTVAFRNWVHAVRRSLIGLPDRGETQYRNLRYDWRRRPETRPAIEAFATYVATVPDFQRRPTNEAEMDAVALSSRALIAQFVATMGAKFRTMVPQICPVAFGLATRSQVSRVIDRDKAIATLGLHCQTLLRVPAAKGTIPSLSLNTLLSDIFKSIANRSEIEKAIGEITPSATWVLFFSLPDRIPERPADSSDGDALWACRQLGLLNRKGSELIQLDFELSEIHGHFRPSIFSAGGYEAFCAADRPDGFGRTATLDTGDEGVPEFVCRSDRHPIIVKGTSNNGVESRPVRISSLPR